MEVKLAESVEAPQGTTHYADQVRGVLWYRNIQHDWNTQGLPDAWHMWDEEKQAWEACDDPCLGDDAEIVLVDDGYNHVW